MAVEREKAEIVMEAPWRNKQEKKENTNELRSGSAKDKGATVAPKEK